MDPIMMAIAAVVIIVILAGVFFVQKNRKTDDTIPQNPVKRPKTLAEQQRDLELQRQTQQTPVSSNLPTSSLQSAEHEASAKELESTESQDDSLDFDLFDVRGSNQNTMTDSSILPTSVPSKLASELSEQPKVITQPTHTPTNQNLNDDVAFDFQLDNVNTNTDQPVVSKQPSVNTTLATESLDLDDFTFDSPQTPPATTQAPTSSTEIFAPTHQHSTQPLEAIESPTGVEDKVIDELDFDFDMPTVSATQATPSTPIINEPVIDIVPPSAQSVDFDEDFDFDFGLDEPTNLATSSQPVTLPQTASTDTLDFDVDESLSIPADDLMQPKPTLDFELPIVTDDHAASEKPTIATDLPATSVDFTSFDLDDTAITPTVEEHAASTPVIMAESLPVADEVEFSLDDEPAAVVPPSETNTVTDIQAEVQAPVTEDLSAAFAVIKEIDMDTLNVDLAEQYIALGEYDSAKRLLDEINNTHDNVLLARVESLRQKIA